LNKQIIGVFDSGVGGLSVLSHIHQRLPNESLLYVADTAFMPYGCKSEQTVQDRCLRITSFFAARQCKAVVIACNTATAAAVYQLRDTYPFPIVGMEPAVKPAMQHSRSKVVGILATSGTLGSDKFQQLKQRFVKDATLIVQPCPGLVERIEQGEHGDLNNEAMRTLLRSFLDPLVQQGIDTLVLGCTHYPLIATMIREIVGDSISIIDSGDAIARELERRLDIRLDIQSVGKQTEPQKTQQASPIEFWSSGDIQHADVLMSRLWGNPVKTKKLPF